MLKEDGSLTSEDQEKAELLNKYFKSVFTREDISVIPTLKDRHNNVYLTDMDITEDIVEKKLNKLKVTKSSGPDGFHPRILSELSKSIKSPYVLFSTSHCKKAVYRSPGKMHMLRNP